MGSIQTAHILISRTCVNNCVFCTVARKRSAGEFPSREDIVRFIRDSASGGVRHLVFSGLGEPTLDPHFEDYLRLAGDRGIEQICLFTNGYGLTPEKAQRWRAMGASSVLLSIHGMERGHDRNVQREGSFREAVAALEIYLKHGYAVTINTCLTRLNLTEIPGLRDFLAGHPIRMQTLAFPEWSGNVESYVDYMVTYEEVAQSAEALIPPGDRVAYFDNIPYCLVRKKIREMQGLAGIRLLDGAGDKEYIFTAGKLFPPACDERGCPVRALCPGIEKNYVAARGWGNIPARVEEFLNALDRAGFREEILSSPDFPLRPRVAGRREVLRPGADHPRSEGLVAVIKPTSRCNAGCEYCPTRVQSPLPDLKLDLFRRLGAELLEYAKVSGKTHLTFLWHGGEPLLLGTSFYRSAWEEFKGGSDATITHLIQTNLLLLDVEWVELLRLHSVHVSTSVDPLGHERVYRDGRPQYPDWVEKFALACEGNLHLGIVLTVTTGLLDRAEEIYHFAKNLQTFSLRPVGIRVNPVYPARAGVGAGPEDFIDPKEYGRFLVAFWERWIRDGRTFPVSPLDEWMRGGGYSCEFSGHCQEHFLAMNGNGDIFHCGRFADTGPPRGNIRDETLGDILARPPRLDFSTRAEQLRSGECRGCPYWKYCRGGCPYHAFLLHGEGVYPSPFCESYQMVLSRIHADAAGSGGGEVLAGPVSG